MGGGSEERAGGSLGGLQGGGRGPTHRDKWKLRRGPLNEDVFSAPPGLEEKAPQPGVQELTEQIHRLLLQVGALPPAPQTARGCPQARAHPPPQARILHPGAGAHSPPPWASGWRVWTSWVEVGGGVPPAWEAKLAPGDWRNPLLSLGTQPSGRIPVSTWARGEQLPASLFPGAGGTVSHLVLSLNPMAMDSLGTGIQARPRGWRRVAHRRQTLGPSPAPPGAPRGLPPSPASRLRPL